MAQDGEPSKPVDKGKGKAVDGDVNKTDEVKKDKDGKPIVNGKKEDGIIGGRLTVRSSWGVLTGNNSSRRAQRGGSTTQERA